MEMEKGKHSFERNRLLSIDLVTAVAYIAKVESSLYGGEIFNPFERLLNDELDVDRPMVLCSVYETVTGENTKPLFLMRYERLLQVETRIVDGDYEDTPGFISYQYKAKNELLRFTSKINSLLDDK